MAGLTTFFFSPLNEEEGGRYTCRSPNFSTLSLFHIRSDKWEDKIGENELIITTGMERNPPTTWHECRWQKARSGLLAARGSKLSLVMCTPYVWENAVRNQTRLFRFEWKTGARYPCTTKDDEPTDLCSGVSDTEQLLWLPSMRGFYAPHLVLKSDRTSDSDNSERMWKNNESGRSVEKKG